MRTVHVNAMRLSVFLFAALASAQVAAATIALVPDRVIDGISDRARTGTAVLVEDRKITGLVDRSNIPAGATVIDLHGMTLLPGMINLHEHPAMWADDYQHAHLESSSAYKALTSLATVQKYLLNGWTSVRIPGDADVFYANQDLEHAINEGLFTGPRLTGAGHYISITGGGGDVNFMSPEQTIIPDGLIADGPDEIRKAVRREAKYGSEWIKLLVTGAYQSVGDNPRNVAFSPEELKAAVDEAHRLGLPVAAHAHADEGIREAILAGVQTIEHGTFISDASIKLMVQKGVFLVPTIYVGDYYGEGTAQLLAQEKNDEYLKVERPKFIERLRRAHKAGVKIGVGTDMGGAKIVDASILARELVVLLETGMSPMEVLQAATRVGAEALQWDDRLGILEAGKLADIIAVPGNPLEDMNVMQKVGFVMLGGKVIKQPGKAAVLDGTLEQH